MLMRNLGPGGRENGLSLALPRRPAGYVVTDVVGRNTGGPLKSWLCCELRGGGLFLFLFFFFFFFFLSQFPVHCFRSVVILCQLC